MAEVRPGYKRYAWDKVFKRIITGLLLAITAIVLIIWGVIPLAVFILILALIGINEFIDLAIRHKIRPSRTMGVFGVVVLIGFSCWGREEYISPLVVGIALITMLFYIFRKGLHVSSFMDVSVDIMGIIYLGWFFCYMIFMRKLNIPETHGFFRFFGIKIDQGAGFVLLLIFSTALTDTGAFFVGKLLGRHKLCPNISPGKTVEGSIGGIFGALAGAFLVGLQLPLPVTDIVTIGLLCGIFAQLGDLWESILKRDVHVKDSGSILAGHGGVLDRVDSYLFTIPIIYYYIKYFML